MTIDNYDEPRMPFVGLKDPIFLTDTQLQMVCNLTERLTMLRQNECSHLCIENVAPEIFGKLVAEMHFYLNGTIRLPDFMHRKVETND